MAQTNWVTIRIKAETRQRLKKRGNLGDTYDIVINKFLDGFKQ